MVDMSTNEAIVIFNDGNQGRLKIMQSLGLTDCQFAHKSVTLIDIKRIQTAEVHFNLRTKEAGAIVRENYGLTTLSRYVIRTKIRFQSLTPHSKTYMGLAFYVPALSSTVSRENENPDIGLERKAFPPNSGNILQKLREFLKYDILIFRS
ncbi:hypothetical protein TNCV_3653441 [Trichonephila clavipes]|nr:hypothetical protein TNCV_3653441 [Trichonephila clavipes]